MNIIKGINWLPNVATQLLHVSHCLCQLLTVSRCLSQSQRVAACLSLSPTVAALLPQLGSRQFFSADDRNNAELSYYLVFFQGLKECDL